MENVPFVLVFPGQGAQSAGMGKDIAAALPEVRAMFEQADRLLGIPRSAAMFDGPDAALIDTAVQQPALVLIGLAMKKAIEVRHGRPLPIAAAAGLSLGEYAALSAVGALKFEDTLQLVRKRGELMKMASERVPCGMAVVMNLERQKIEAACVLAAQQTGKAVSVSNFNGGGQIVIGGAAEALAAASDLCKAAGARRVIKLPVAGAFHTALMQPAADGFNPVLDAAAIQTATAPVYANVSASPVTAPDQVRDALKRQITSPVLWEQTVQNIVAAGHRRFLELGSGSTVTNMIKRIAPNAECTAVSSWEGVEQFKF